MKFIGKCFNNEWIRFECEGGQYTRDLINVTDNSHGCTGAFRFKGLEYVFTMEVKECIYQITPVINLEEIIAMKLQGNSPKVLLNEKFVASVHKLYEAFSEVLENWDDDHDNTVIHDAYPFGKMEFTQLTSDVLSWRNACEMGELEEDEDAMQTSNETF